MYQLTKRLLDCSAAFLLLVVLFPLILIVALLLRFSQKQVIFTQRRPGHCGKVFTLYKFCSMNDARDEHGELLPDRKRLTKTGALIRRMSIDELPQLWNVLRGDMSLVGPRPLLVEYLSIYSSEQARRHEVKPGITGWSQVNGRNALSWEEKFRLDVWYVSNASIWLDFRILLLTIAQVFGRSGISHDGHVTMPLFEGKDASGNSGTAG